MALSTCVFTLTWENTNEIKLTRLDEGEENAITILNIEENGSWKDWEHIASLMNNTFARKVEAVGEVMKG